MTQHSQWTCDNCGHIVVINSDGYMPLGWIHSMLGEDLCATCSNR